MYVSLLYQYPIWFTAVLFILFLLLALEIGFRIGRLWKQRDLEAGAGSGGIALTAMYALLGLVLTLVMTIITDFDRGMQGFVRLSQQSLVDTLQSMDAMPCQIGSRDQ